MKCIKVELKNAEKIKKELLQKGIFNKNYVVQKDKEYIYFPVTKKIKGFKIIDKKLKRNKNQTLEIILKKKLNAEEIKLIPKSYDSVGTICILEMDKNLIKKKKIIAKAFLKVNPQLKTIVIKLGEHKGEYRIQEYEYLAGEKNFETIHKENAVKMKLNINKVYFSPRSANERLRIAKEIKKDEVILVMFSGVGAYPLVFAKNSKAKEIYGIEINPEAHKYAEENKRINGITEKIKNFCGDVKEVLPKIEKKFDRIIMPLPKTSFDFLELALTYLNKGGIIHLYCFSPEEEIEQLIKKIKEKCSCTILKVNKCGQQSPRIYRFCIDIKPL